MRTLILYVFVFCLCLLVVGAQEGDATSSQGSQEIYDAYAILGLNEDNLNEGPPLELVSGQAQLTAETPGTFTLNGETAVVDAQVYTGTITIGEKGGRITAKNGDLVLAGGGTVTLVDGIVQLQGASLEEGSTIVDGEGREFYISGRDLNIQPIEPLPQFLEVISENTIMLTIGENQVQYTPMSGEGITLHTVYQQGAVEGHFSIAVNQVYQGACRGSCLVNEHGTIRMLGSQHANTEYQLPNGAVFRSTETTLVCKLGSTCSSNVDNTVLHNGDLIIDLAERSEWNSDSNSVEVEVEDGIYENIAVRQIHDDLSRVSITLKKADGSEAFFSFNDFYPVSRGNIEGLQTSIGNVFQDAGGNIIPWMLVNGQRAELGTIVGGAGNVDRGLIDVLSNTDSEQLANLITSFLGPDHLVDILIGGDYTPEQAARILPHIETLTEWDVRRLFRLYPSSQFQHQLIDRMEGTSGLSLLEDAQENPSVQQRLLEVIGPDQINIFQYKNLNEFIADEVHEFFVLSLKPSVRAVDSIRRTDDLEQQRVALEQLREIDDHLGYVHGSLLLENLHPSLQEQALDLVTDYSGERTLLRIDLAQSDEERIRLALDRIEQGVDSSRGFDDNYINLFPLLERYPEAQTALLQSEFFFSTEEAFSTFQALGTNPEAQALFAARHLADFDKARQIRFFMTHAATPEVMDFIQETNPQNRDPGWDEETIVDVRFDPRFVELTEDLIPEARWSVAVSVQRLITQEGNDFTQEQIQQATSRIIQERERVSSRVLLGPEHQVIIAGHDERWSDGSERFSTAALSNFAEDSGVSQENIVRGSGPSFREEFLESIAESSGPTTIMFSGHGGPNHLWLNDGQIGSHVSDNLDREEAVSFVNLGDALVERVRRGGTLSDVNIMISACHSHDFQRRVYEYVEHQLASTPEVGRPTATIATNRDQLSYSIRPTGDPTIDNLAPGQYFRGIQGTKPPGEELTVQHVFDSESAYSRWEDSAVFTQRDTTVDTQVLGSTNDDPDIDADTLQLHIEIIEQMEAEELITPSSVLEISQIEPEMEQRLFG